MEQRDIVDLATHYFLRLKNFLEHSEVEPILLSKFGKDMEDVPLIYVLKGFCYELIAHMAKVDNDYSDAEALLLEKITGERLPISHIKANILDSFVTSKKVPVLSLLVCYADSILHSKYPNMTAVDDVFCLAQHVLTSTMNADGRARLSESAKFLEILKPIRQFLDDYKKKRDNNSPIDWESIRKKSFKNYL